MPGRSVSTRPTVQAAVLERFVQLRAEPRALARADSRRRISTRIPRDVAHKNAMCSKTGTTGLSPALLIRAHAAMPPDHNSKINIKKRSGRDSNPRCGYPHTAFPVRPLQPLGHRSKTFDLIIMRSRQRSGRRTSQVVSRV